MTKPNYKPSKDTHFIDREEALNQMLVLARTVRKYPTNWPAKVNLGNAYFTVGNTEAALELFLQAHELAPDNAVVCSNVGIALAEMTRFTEAFAYIEKANKLDPADKYAASVYAEFLLRAGQWRMGWDLYERCRFSLPECPLPKFTGEQSLQGKRILVIQEGGAGDVFMALRFFKELKVAGAETCFACDEPLHCVVAEHPWVDTVVTFGSKIDLFQFDYYVSSFSLTPIYAPTPEHAIWQWPGPYMKTEHDVPHIVGSKRKVGLCWRAGEADENKRHRCLSPENIRTLTANSSVRWVNLQYGETLTGAENPKLDTWEDTADVIDGLDLVITVDTGVMHLAGAIGKPVWTLLSNSCWRFLLNGEECVFYPTMRLFRNHAKGYDDAVEMAVQKLYPKLRMAVS